MDTSLDDKFLKSIRDWMTTIRQMRLVAEKGGVDYYVQVLVWCHNAMTNPAALRTDAEHLVCGKMAKWCFLRLRSLPHWHEHDSGYLHFQHTN